MGARRSLLFFALASVLFGTTFVAAKAGLPYFPPLLFVALRFDIAAVVLFGFALLTTDRAGLVPRTRGDLAGIFATGVLAVGLTNALLFVGQQYVTSGVASIIYSLNPILTPVLAAGLLAEDRLSRRGMVGTVLGLLGVGLVVSPAPSNLLGGSVLGKAILFGGVLTAALGSVLVRRADGSLSSSVRTAWSLPVAALVCHLLSLAAGESVGAITWSPTAVIALLYVAVFAGATAYIAYFGLIDTAGVIRANLVFYVVPVVATVGGWALLGETISALALIGFLTIFAGFAVLGSEEVDIRRVIVDLVPTRPEIPHRLDRRARDNAGSLRTDGGANDRRFGRSDDAGRSGCD